MLSLRICLSARPLNAARTPLIRVGHSIRQCRGQPQWSCRVRPCMRKMPHAPAAAKEPTDAPVVAVEGDIVTIHFDIVDSDTGEVLESSRSSPEAVTFEVGTGDIVGNNIFEAFDEAVRGYAVGDKVRIKAEGGEWNRELLFVVPRDHEEVERLENRYKNLGGLVPSAVVQLSNGQMAVVVEADEQKVILDANSMLAGKKLNFELELIDIQRGN